MSQLKTVDELAAEKVKGVEDIVKRRMASLVDERQLAKGLKIGLWRLQVLLRAEDAPEPVLIAPYGVAYYEPNSVITYVLKYRADKYKEWKKTNKYKGQKGVGEEAI